ncbi:hypothetical protein ACEZCY_10920 [Streptacidiphilus sp. N1-12]|uniref:Uncharacterized protein n=2 Tax=Streptacidiphilus alkalitolerans TaxID=3342712 RepID=A0ABV6V6J0_9ACTN
MSLTAVLAVAALCGSFVIPAVASAPPPQSAQQHRAGRGSVLLDETFQGSSIADPGFVPLDSVCLTGAAAEPPADESATGPCDGPDQTVPYVPTPGQTPGWLQLTDGANYRVGGLLYNRPLPGNGGLEVSFDQYQYGGNGADGIGFLLVDGAVDLTHAGADGGSLGYAQRNLTPGVVGGFLGIGLDAYGNFANDAEYRGKDCPPDEQSPVAPDRQVTDSVTLRGPGEGIEGYCFLDSTMRLSPGIPPSYVTTLPGSLREPGVTVPDTARRTVMLTVSPDEKPLITIDIDFHDGKGFQQVLQYQMKIAAPKTYKFGFTGSSGGLIDTHLIRNLQESSVVPLDQLNLVKTVASDRLMGTRRTYRVGDTVTYNFLVTNTGTSTLSPVTVTDPLVSDIVCPETSLGPVGSPTASMQCTGTHVITVNDSFTGELSNTATAHGTDPGGKDVPSNPSTAVVQVEQLTPGLEITKTASPTRAEPGSTVTYTVKATNTGEVRLDPADFTDDLSGVLDDAVYNDDATATVGTVVPVQKTLHWTGPLEPGDSTTVTYSVTVNTPDRGDLLLHNTVGTTIPNATCAEPGPPPSPLDVAAGTGGTAGSSGSAGAAGASGSSGSSGSSDSSSAAGAAGPERRPVQVQRRTQPRRAEVQRHAKLQRHAEVQRGTRAQRVEVPPCSVDVLVDQPTPSPTPTPSASGGGPMPPSSGPSTGPSSGPSGSHPSTPRPSASATAPAQASAGGGLAATGFAAAGLLGAAALAIAAGVILTTRRHGRHTG